jgi:DMSO/TMAO reductase YedYZ molybdopterin-dependent catalytic subunit
MPAVSHVERRAFLRRLVGLAAGTAAAGVVPPRIRAAFAEVEMQHELIERGDRPEQWETTIPALANAFLTDNSRFFVRSHLSVPSIDPETHTIELAGGVGRPYHVTLRELARLPRVESVVTLECAGNGRALFGLPNTSGVQWEHGAVGTARWGGVRLAALIERAGPRPDARHVWFECADAAPLSGTPAFTRSIPLEKAMDDVLLATRMNGEPLPVMHGGPARIVVPGWYGMASAKWVTRIRLEPGPSDNHFMVKGYRYQYAGESEQPPVEAMRVKSIITSPLEGERARLSTNMSDGGKLLLRVQGLAWAGPPGVARVEVSADAGASWGDAALGGRAQPGAWRSFSARLSIARRGPITIMARATDGAGDVQPLAARPNAAGYANNSIHRVRVHAA